MKSGWEITPEFCARFGGSGGHSGQRGTGGPSAAGIFQVGEPLLDACGIRPAALAATWPTLAKGCWGSLSYGMQFCALSRGVYLQGRQGVSLRLVASGGLPATRASPWSGRWKRRSPGEGWPGGQGILLWPAGDPFRAPGLLSRGN